MNIQPQQDQDYNRKRIGNPLHVFADIFQDFEDREKRDALIRLLCMSGANPQFDPLVVETLERLAPEIIPIAEETKKYRDYIVNKYQLFTKNEEGKFTDQIDDSSVRELSVLNEAGRLLFLGCQGGVFYDTGSQLRKILQYIANLPIELRQKIYSCLFFSSSR